MPGTNLTRDEARTRAGVVSDVSYAIELDLTNAPGGAPTFPSVTTITFTATDGASTFADLIADQVREVTLNGRSLAPDAVYDGARIQLDGLAERNELRVVADCLYSRTGEGLHRSVDPADKETYLYTQFEVPDARRVFATFEQPNLKAPFTFTVSAPARWVVISNSPTPEPTPYAGPSGEELARWEFPPTERMSTYITAVVAGPYHVVTDCYEGPHGTYPLSLLCRPSLKEALDTEDLFEVTKQGFALFERAFGTPYPFHKYDQAFVPEYNMGAMENAGCVTLRDEYIFRSRTTHAELESRANTVLHELAHMWFGDLVTMTWWDDLWLNESFAEWASHWAQATATTKYAGAWTTFCNARKNWAYRQDQLPSTHPIAADMVDFHAVEVNFDGITYAKGASTLRQLVAFVGEDTFITALKEYFADHAFGNTELTDLLKPLEKASGRDLDDWTERWLRTAGVNTLRADFAVDDAGAFTSFAIEQTAIETYPTLRPHRLAVGLYRRTDEGLVRTERFEVDIDGARTDLPELVGATQPDLVLLNDDDLTYAKIRLDERSRATLVESIDQLTESLPRALAWGAAWDMTRDAEMPASQYVGIVLRGIRAETDLTGVRSLLGQATSAINLYAAPANRPALRAQFEVALASLLAEAEAGSDHQLAFARAYTSAVFSDAGADRLAAWLDGRDLPTGLVVDTDLRWTLIVALARLGRVGADEIDDELTRDTTITGQERAAQARAARPTAEAKEEAWRIAVESDDTPNETQYRTILGFQQPGQEELLRPYVGKYLSAAKDVYTRLGSSMGENVLVYLSPRNLAEQSALDALTDWLAAESATVDAPTRRYVSEAQDDLTRAIAAQVRDAS
ncbi:aminopeptidase N [Kribbella sandramycini]|uniref:Aminopeptidase N n=1 Tax=Kribbella sandramycini TaxID=60450 RepID=A0A7Y4NXI9_9ACTN|nr:aminopeptidase N [Kribbella sandramycini]MBB6567889.1 aminopeptidase N [Kribbella sandramycini]NOL39516.1 aminopeptidase N [Kribbella sandramycini]